jgi:hypothetical protein
VPYEVFDVFGEMLNAVVEVAAAQDDSRVVLTVLELASLITCTAGEGCSWAPFVADGVGHKRCHAVV